jgi:arsenite methyltransferase
MAELTGSPDAAATSACCAPEQQVDCCEPADKAECCSSESGCGCLGGASTDEEIPEAVGARKPS